MKHFDGIESFRDRNFRDPLCKSRLYPAVIKEVQTTVFMGTEWPVDIRALHGLRSAHFPTELFARL
jgi:hypothetical protein